MEEQKGFRIMSMAVRSVAGLVFLGWIMMWIMEPTTTYWEKWRPKIMQDTSSTYLGTQGSTILIFTFPVLFISVLGCAYVYLERNRKDYRKRSYSKYHAWLKRPLLLKGPLGIASSIELVFFIMFLILLIWCFSMYLHVSFSNISSASAKQEGIRLWQARLGGAGVSLGLLGNVCFAFLFFPITRVSSILPLVGLSSESSVRYHIWLGHIVMTIFTAHGACFIIDWISTGNASQMLKWSKEDVSIVAGELSLLSGLVMWATTLPRIRRRMFELFFYTHQLYTLFLIFFLLHVGISFFCMALPGIYLFALDRCLRFLQSRAKVQLVSARLLPGETVELNFAKHPGLEYSAASTVFVNVPSISKLQWHPFTVSSSCSFDTKKLSVVIKKEGSWTQKLYHTLSSPPVTDHLEMSLEGPYGPISNHFLRYSTLILISGGSGITPFISMIRELIHASRSPNATARNVHLICAFKSSADLSMLKLLLPTYVDNTSGISSLDLRIEAFVTREREPSEESRKRIRTVSFKPSPTHKPIYPILCPNTWIWLGLVISSSFVAYLVLLVFLDRYYIYPIDKNTDKNYSWSARALLNLLLMCVAIGGVATAAVVTTRRRMAEVAVHAPSTMTTRPAVEEEIELESVLEETLWQLIKVKFGERPDIKKMLKECKESNTGVLASGPAELRRQVAAICSSESNLHFESISFSW